MTKPIGIFDSGLGGLTVAKEIMAAMPHQPIVYFGDCLRVPYGDRDDNDLKNISKEIINFLAAKDVGAMVVACGTISSRILSDVKAMTELPVFAMLEAGVRAAVETTKNKRVGIIATEGSIRAKGFENAILAACPEAEITAVACPLFAYIVEEGWTDNAVAYEAAKIYMQPFHGRGIDTLLLGCTHYPLLAGVLRKNLPAGVQLVDPAKYLAQEVKRTICAPTVLVPKHEFYVSAKKERFDRLAQMILGIPVDAYLV